MSDNFSKLTIIKLNELFKSKSLRIDVILFNRFQNKNSSVPASFIDVEQLPTNLEGPFVKTKLTNLFTLVLDLDETLIHFEFV